MDIAQLVTDLTPSFVGGVQFEITRYLTGTLATLVVIWFIASHFIKGRKIRKPAQRKAQLRQIRMELKNSAVTILVFSLMNTVLFSGPVSNMFKLYNDPAVYGGLYYWASIPLFLVLHDTYFYWTHRAMHSKRLYKLFHMTHHRSHNPTPFTAYNFAPGEAIVEFAFVPIVLLLFPIHSTALYIVMTIMIFKNATGHCGYEIFPRSWAKLPVFGWLTTVTHHDMHHERGTGNYGFYFTWWDRMMGTEHANYHQRLEDSLQRDQAARAVRKAAARAVPVAAE